MSKTLTTEIHPDWGCWIAYTGNDPWESGTIGEGSTRENAVADYWASLHGYDKTGRILPPNGGESHWVLYDGKTGLLFETHEEAAQYAEQNEYLIRLWR